MNDEARKSGSEAPVSAAFIPNLVKLFVTYPYG